MSTSYLDANTDQEHNSASISDGSLLRWVPRDNPPVMQGVYAPPSLPVSDDFIDLDVYPGSVNTSDEEQGAPENDIDSMSAFQSNSRENTDMDLYFLPIPTHPDPMATSSSPLHPAREPIPLVATSNRCHDENRPGQWNSFGQPPDPWGLYTGEVVSSSPPSMLCLRRPNPEENTGPPSTVGTHPVATRQMTGRMCASSPALEPASSSASSPGRDRDSSSAPSTSSPPLSDGLGRERGLSLVDRYTLEDLCDYLPARQHRCPPRRRQRPQQYRPVSVEEGFPKIDPTSPPSPPPSPPSSCSSSSVSLSLHKRAADAALRKKSTSLPSRIPHSAGKPTDSGGCLVNYLLTCSRLGSNAISDFLPTDSDPCLYCSANGVGSGALDHEVAASNCYQGVLRCPACLAVTDEVDSPPCHLLASDWRRGRSDGLVCVVAGCDAAVCISGATSAAAAAAAGLHLSPSLSSTDLAVGSACACGISSSRPPKPRLSCLIAGRFLPGANSWRSLWPTTASSQLRSGTAEADIVTWISAWIQAGGVLFFAQLDDSSSSSGGGDFTEKAVHELCWRHRLVLGVSGGKHIHLSNPLEVVSASWILSYLAKLTKLSIQKSDVMQLWRLDANFAIPNFTANAYAVGGGGGSGDDCMLRSGLFPVSAEGVSCGSHLGQDLSFLSQQRDIRWSRFNILGQVISTLRDYDSFMERQELGKPPESSLFSLQTANAEFPHTLGSLRSSLLNGPRQSPSFSTSSSGPHNGGSSSTSGLPQECLSSDPNLVIPCAQRPGFSIFMLRKNKELLRNLLMV
ncbi:hypothetical protein AAHC03_017104 [Spirometra sp. Aus1]